MDYKKEAEKLRKEYADSKCADLGWCDTEKCPILGERKGRWDGLCVAETYLHVDGFIRGYNYDIRSLEMKIDAIREKIKKLKSFKKRFEEYLEERE